MAKRRSTHISTLGSQVTSIISVALVLFILGIVAMGVIIGRNITGDIRSNFGFIIKTHTEVTDAAINDIKQQLGQSPFVSSYVFTPADEILARESEYIGQDISELLDVNPYAAEFDVKVTEPYASTDSVDMVVNAVQQWTGVDEVITEIAVIDSVNSALSRLTVILLAVALALLVISFALINNTVSLAIYSRRFVIHTMKLVGATPGFIRRPFVRAGIVTGIISALAAMVCCALVRYYGDSIDAMITAALSWSQMIMIFLLLLVAGIVICGSAAAIATNRYLRADYDDMFMK